jgi:hypothetical protein
MKRATIVLSVLVFAGPAWSQQATTSAKKATTPDALKAEIDALKPAQHVWRAIVWKTCPLEALKEARAQKKPVIAWVFLGLPADERC